MHQAAVWNGANISTTMKSHYVHPTGAALSVASGIIYAACAIYVKLWPMQAISFFNNWFHGIDLTQIAVIPEITAGSFIRGLISIMIFTYLAGALYAWLYQKCEEHCKRKKWIK